MRPEQKEAHDKMIKNYKDGNREFLLAAKMRFGKNFTFLNVAKDLNFKNILVLTYKPQVFSSLKDNISNHVNFDGWKIMDFKEQRNLLESKDKTTVFMSSAQLAQYKKAKAEDDEDFDLENTSIEEIRKNLKELKKIHWDMIIADEYHYGTSTGNFKNILQQLKENSDPYVAYVSGTAMKDIAMGRFEPEQIYEWSYIEEQKKKRDEKEGKSESKEHLSMPTMEIHLVDISSKVKEEVESHYDIEGGEGFTMKKLISTKKDGSLKWPGSLELLLNQIMGIGSNIKISPYNIQNNINHTFWVLPKWTAGIVAMAKMMEKMPAYKGYHILAATGNVVTNIKEVEEAINKYDKTITLTCYRFKEGVSIPKWNGVFMLDDGRSIEEYLQAMFRVQNPDEENNKDKCYVFDFNPKRGLAMTYEICENINKDKSANIEKTFREFRDYAPIHYHQENSLKEVDFNEVMEAFKTFTNWNEKFANVKNLDLEKIDEIIMQSVLGIKPGKRGKVIEITDNDIEAGKNFISKQKIGKNEKILDKNEIKDILRKITTVLANIPEFLFNTSGKEKNLDDLLNTEKADLFEKITGLSLESFNLWVKKGLINPILMTRNILNFSQSESQLMGNLTGERLEDFSKKNFQMRAEEGKTPLKLVKEMLDKLPAETWINPDKKFLDPCMGMGTFLLEIKEKLMKNLSSIPEKKREDYILKNMIFGIDIDESKYTIALKLLKTNEDNNHIRNTDSLKIFEENWKDMKFDVVAGNPPFQPPTKREGAGTGSRNKIWHKFIELGFKSLKEDGWFAFITPHNWRMSNLKNGVEKNAQELMWNNNIVDITPANKFFNVGGNISIDYWIITKDKSIKGLKMPEEFKKLMLYPINNQKIIKDYFSDYFKEKSFFFINIKDNRSYNFESLTSSKKGDETHTYPHLNTIEQYKNKLFDWYDKKTPGFDEKKVIISNSVNIHTPGSFFSMYDTGKLGCGSHAWAYKVESEKVGKDLENFLNNSKIIRILFEETCHPTGFGINLHLIKKIPKSWVNRFNNGEDL